MSIGRLVQAVHVHPGLPAGGPQAAADREGAELLVSQQHVLQTQPDRAPGLGLGGLQQQGELVAAEAKRLIRAADAVGQQLGEAAQHQIAHRVTPGVVDLLEAVEIQQYQHQPVRLPAVLLHRAADGLVEVGAVAEPGQVIEPHLQLQL